MRPSEALDLHKEEIRKIVKQFHAKNPRIFGSVIHHDDTDESDLDLLVDTTNKTSLLDIAKIQNRLQVLLGVSVDVLTPKALPKQFRDRILLEAKIL